VIAPLLAAAVTSVGVGAHEYRFAVYRESVRPGGVRFNIHTFGEDAHNLVVFGPRGYRSATSPDVRPGRTVAFTVRLRRRGTYRLVCLKGGHAARGMRAAIQVR